MFSRRTIFSLLLLVAIALPGAHAISETKATPRYAWEQEEAVFSIKINAKVLNEAEAAQAVIRTGEVQLNQGKPYVPISLQLKSVGMFNALYPMDDRGNTFISPTSHQPLRAEKLIRENGRERLYQVDYDHLTWNAQVLRREGEQEPRRTKQAIPDNTHDALSWVYSLRSRGDYTIGEEFSYYLFDGWKLSRLLLTVAAEERILTPSGWHDTWRIDMRRQFMFAAPRVVDKKHQSPQITEGKETPMSGSLWLGKDPRRLPVKIQMESRLGSGEAVLVRYKRLEERASVTRPIKQTASPAKPKTP